MHLIPALLIVGSIVGAAQAAETTPAKVLVFTRSQGFEHSMVKVVGGKPAQVETELAALGLSHDFTITVTKDGGEFTADKLKAYDLFFFYTTGDLTKEGGDHRPPMTPAGKQALLDAIAGGKGFVGVHSASDTFHSPSGAHSFEVNADPDPYVKMLGGEFIVHGAQQAPKITTVDHAFPGMNAVGDSFSFQEEWYSLKQFAPDLHVIQVLDTAGMRGNMYQRGPYPITWIHPYGKGRVFYTAMGHREDVWTNTIFRATLTGGIDYALGRSKVDDRPNLAAVVPTYAELPPAKPAKPAK
jgi:type 1 glutamine amidotransferase